MRGFDVVSQIRFMVELRLAHLLETVGEKIIFFIFSSCLKSFNQWRPGCQWIIREQSVENNSAARVSDRGWKILSYRGKHPGRRGKRERLRHPCGVRAGRSVWLTNGRGRRLCRRSLSGTHPEEVRGEKAVVRSNVTPNHVKNGPVWKENNQE